MPGSVSRAPTLVLGVPAARVALAFAAYVLVVVLVNALDGLPAQGATFVSIAFALFTSATLFFNLRRAREYAAGRRGWMLISIAGVVAIVFELALAAESAFPGRVRIPPIAWLVQTVASNGAIALGVLLLPYR